MKKLFLLLFLILTLRAAGQNTTVSFTMVDTDSQAWFSANWKMDFRPNPAFPSESSYRLLNGQPLSAATLHQTGTTDSTGAASISVYDNTLVAPAGSGWTLTLCANASVQCGVYQFTTAGSTMDLSLRLKANLSAPRFTANGAGAFGYVDVEAMVSISIGGCYWNVTSNQQRCWDGTEFVVANQGPAGPAGPVGPAGPNGPPGGSLSYPGVVSDGNNGLTVTGGIATSSSIASSPPVMDIRHPSFAGGAICDGTQNHPIDAALQAAINAMPTNGGNILIVSNPLSCFLAQPQALKWTGHGLITIQLNGVLNLGTTWTISKGSTIAIVGQSGKGSTAVSFAFGGEAAALFLQPTSGTGSGQLGTWFTPDYTGTGNPSATVPVACSNATNGKIYQDTNATSAIYWTCAATTGSITAGSNQLTVASVGGFSGTNDLTVAGAGTSGGTLTCRVSGISGNVFTLVLTSDGVSPCNAGTTVSGAAVTITADQYTVSTANNVKNGWIVGAVYTFTPSSMSALFPNSAITVSSVVSCNISTISRTSNKVTATLSSQCKIPAGVNVVVAGVTDTSFNGQNSGALFKVQNSDYVANTEQWTQGAAPDASSTGGTVTGLNEDTEENVRISRCSATTCTATFFRTHTAADWWGVDGFVDGSNASPTLLKNLQIRSPGTEIWLQVGYQDQLENVSTLSTLQGATGACGADVSNNVFSHSLDVTNTSFVWINKSSLVSSCMPYSARITIPFGGSAGNGGPFYIDNSFLLTGVKLDHSGTTAYIRNSVCDQCPRAVVTYDESVGNWTGVLSNQIQINNVLLQDNPNNWTTCMVHQATLTNSLVANVEISNTYGTGCGVNDYFTGQLRNSMPQKWGVNTTNRGGVYNTLNDGKTLDADIRGSNAGLAPSLIPYQTANIPQTSSGWTSNFCAVTPNLAAPDGSLTAAGVVQGTGGSGVFGSVTGITPAVGDMVLWGVWVRRQAVTAGADSASVVSALILDKNASTHFHFFNETSLGSVDAAQWESQIANDWYHPVVGFTYVTSTDGATNQTVRSVFSCNPFTMQILWNPWMMYIPASAGYSIDEVRRWRQQLMHGYVPPNAAAGALYTNVPFASVTSNVNKVLNVTAPPFNASGSLSWFTCTTTAGSTSLPCTVATDFSPGQGIYIPHAGAATTAVMPSAPTISNVAVIIGEPHQIPASTPYTVTANNTVLTNIGVAYCGIAGPYATFAACTAANPITQAIAFHNLGNIAPTQRAVYSYSSNTYTFYSGDASMVVSLAYTAPDTAGTQTRFYQVASLDALGGLSALSPVSTTTGSRGVFTTTGNGTSGTNTITLAYAYSGMVGLAIAGATGIPGGTTITTVAGNVVTLSANLTGNVTPAVNTLTVGTQVTAMGGNTFYNVISWPSTSSTTGLTSGYALYRDGILIGRVDEPDTWEPRQGYYIGDTIIPMGATKWTGCSYTALNDGVTAYSAQPTWPTTNGATVTENLTGVYDVTMPVTWQATCPAMVTYLDYNQINDFSKSNTGNTVFEPNIPMSLPASALADALVTTVTGSGGSTITLAAAPQSSGAVNFVTHDDTAALNAAFSVRNSTPTMNPAIYIPQGMYQISSPLTVPVAGGGAFRIFADGSTTGYNNNGYYGNQFYMGVSLGAGGGIITTQGISSMGATIRAIDATPMMLNLTGQTNRPVPSIDRVTFLGYGVGKQTCIEGQDQNTGAGSLSSLAAWYDDRFYNCYRGLRYSFQWSSFYNLRFAGNVIAFGTNSPQGAGITDSNQISLYNPSFQSNILDIRLRSSSHQTLIENGVFESSYSNIRGTSSTLITNSFYTEPQSTPAVKTAPSIDMLSCAGCNFKNTSSSTGQIGSGNSMPLFYKPSWIIRAAGNDSFNQSASAGALYLCPQTAYALTNVGCMNNYFLGYGVTGSQSIYSGQALVLNPHTQFNYITTSGNAAPAPQIPILDLSSPQSTTVVIPGVGFTVNGNPSVSCPAGAPSASFTVVNGIVTHC